MEGEETGTDPATALRTWSVLMPLSRPFPSPLRSVHSLGVTDVNYPEDSHPPDGK